MATDTAVPQVLTPIWVRVAAKQEFWITIAVVLIPVLLTVAQPDFAETFWKWNNLTNSMRNLALVGIMSLGMVAVIVTGGIDISVGSIMAVVGVVLGMLMSEGHSIWFSVGVALLSGLACGFFNGYLIAYLKLPSFVVTLGMMSMGRSLAMAISENKFFEKLGPDEPLLNEIGGGRMFDLVPNPFLVLVVLTLLTGFMFRYTTWGRHLFAIGGNEHAARLTGVPVDAIKLSAYVLSSLTAAISAILFVGWFGSVTNGLGQNYELQVIAAAVIGGANLVGGEGTAYGAFIGAALLEVIRNGLLLAGVDPNWQKFFVGIFLVFAVLLERVRGRKVN
jgi:ribose transport system permease protein